MKFRYLTPYDVRLIHEHVIRRYGGIEGERDPGLINFIADKPRQELYGQELYPGLFLKAAVYLHGFAAAQYFADGNKRTGTVCCLTFLYLNGYRLNASNKELFDVVLKVANKQMDLSELAEWLESKAIKLT